MTKLDEMANDEIWEQVEECFQSIHEDVKNRCYSKHSMTGARYIQYLVRQHLAWIDRALLEIEIRNGTGLEPVLERIEEGLTTAADAKFFRKLLSLKDEKGSQNSQKGLFCTERQVRSGAFDGLTPTYRGWPRCDHYI